MITSVHPSAYISVELLYKHNVRYVVHSPGARNTPLVIALSAYEGIKVLSIIDERTAAFVALGLAARTGAPVALVCTSGTAILDYAPAIAEAYYRNIPLIIISADRPAEWIDQEDGQTIRQNEVLANIVKGSYDIPTFVSQKDSISSKNAQDYLWYVNRIVNSAILKSLSQLQGPVHINLHFGDKLNETQEINVEQRVVKSISPAPVLTLSQIKDLINDLNPRKILILAGQNPPDARISRAVKRLSQCPTVSVFCEAQSNLKSVDNAIDCIDGVVNILTQSDKTNLLPDLVISFGGGIMSKSLKEWLRVAPPSMQHWRLGVNRNDELTDTYQHLSACFNVDVASFLSSLSHVLMHKNEGNYSSAWLTKLREFKCQFETLLENAQWSDLVAMNIIMQKLKPYHNLQVSNGMSIRNIQYFNYRKFHRIDSNRGCNGIEGSTSTAIGASIDCNIPTVLISGDMSFQYDIGALSLKHIPNNFRVIVMNNNGGEIFRTIDTTKNLSVLEERFVMPQNTDYKKIAATFNFVYLLANDCDSLKKAIETINCQSTRPILLEVNTSATL